MKRFHSDCQVLPTLAEYTRYFQLPAPAHPLLFVLELMPRSQGGRPLAMPAAVPVVPGLYTVFLKRNLTSPLHYGHQPYDFSAGVLGFSAPGQVFRVNPDVDVAEVSGWVLLFHPDLLSPYPLGQKIKEYTFFRYEVHEALHLSEAEQTQLGHVLAGLQAEAARPVDAFSNELLVAQLEVLLTQANRFYQRQFHTRRAPGHDLLTRFERALARYFAFEAPAQPLPSVHYFAEALHVSPAYLSDMLRALTGQGAQQHLQQALLAKAKYLLRTTNLSVKETAFQLGFDYPPYFSRLFKQKTGLSPVEFRCATLPPLSLEGEAAN